MAKRANDREEQEFIRAIVANPMPTNLGLPTQIGWKATNKRPALASFESSANWKRSTRKKRIC